MKAYFWYCRNVVPDYKFNIRSNDIYSKEITINIKNQIKNNHHECWLKKSQHGYLFRSYDNIPNKNEKLDKEWLKKGNLSSHVEGYICAIEEEEINTHYLKSKRNNNINAICRLCKQQNEISQHVVASCPFISASMYLPFLHDKVAYFIYKQILTSKRDEKVYVQEFYKDDSIEVWCDTKIKTLQKIQHNRPDTRVWKIKEKLCFIIDVSICLDVNVDKNYKLKHSSYLPLVAELKRLYEHYKFEVVSIVVGATGLVTNTLAKSVEKLGMNDINNNRNNKILSGISIVRSIKDS